MLRDVAIFLIAVGIAAALALLVNPLLWTAAVIAVAWLLGREGSLTIKGFRLSTGSD